MAQGLTPFDDMNALQKIGFVLQNTADPTTLPRYQQQLEAQTERQRQLEQQNKLAELAPQLGGMAPQQAFSALAAINPEFINPLMQFRMQQEDPLRKIQFASANMDLQNARAEAQRGKELANLFANPATSPVGTMGPEIPRQLSPLELLQKAASKDPNKFALPLFETISKQGQPSLPEGTKIPEGYMPQFDQTGRFTGVAQLPGLPENASGPKLTKDQASAATFAERMASAEQTFNPYQNTMASFAQAGKAATPLIGNYLVSPEYQVARQAQENFVSANLREESGAAISEEEMDREIKKYFPQPGDSQAVVDTKAKSRKIAYEGMIRAAGPAKLKLPQPENKPKAGTPPFQQAPLGQIESTKTIDGRRYINKEGQWYETSN